jgi:uncharacterized membrane protein YhhN
MMKYLGILFILIAVYDILASGKNIRKLRFISKPLLMPLLALFYGFGASDPNPFILFALAGAFIGDIFLMWSEIRTLFTTGVFAFFMGHILYILALIQPVSFVSEIPAWFFLFIAFYIGFAIIIMKILLPYLKEMRYPVMAYLGVILLMSFCSLCRFWHYSGLTFLLPFLGSLLFITSDTIIAFHHFKARQKAGDMLITLFYIPAQALIVLGFMV